MQHIILTPKELLTGLDAHIHTEATDGKLYEGDTPYMTCDEWWIMPEGDSMPCILLEDGPDYITVWEPQCKVAIMGIPKSKVDIEVQ